MKVLTPAEVSAKSVETLGLDSTLLDLSSVEAIACALRRAAGFFCPCSRRTLIKTAFEPLRGVHVETDLLALVEDTLEALVVHGDLLELCDATQEAAGNKLLFAAPPSFVRRSSGTIMLLGVAPDGVSPVPSEIEQAIEHVNHVRILRNENTDFSEQLNELGLIELKLSAWTKAPRHETAAEYVARMSQLIERAQVCGELPDLSLLEPKKPVRYYRGRWVEPARQTGRFVGRRPQAYGADLWCYVEVQEGRAVRLVDFPTRDDHGRGCDEAWRLQAAIDHERGDPQVYRVRSGPDRSQVIDLFSPVPMWARRRWEAIGEPATTSGCLFSLKFSEADVGEEIAFAREYIWLKQTRH